MDSLPPQGSTGAISTAQVKPKPPKPKPSRKDDTGKPPPRVVLPEHVVDQVKEEA